MQSLFSLSVVLVAAAAVAAGLCARMRIPTLLGYLLAGLMIGPSVGRLVQPGEALTFLAEIGVILLMFTVGLELSVAELWATRWRVLSAGGLQFTLAGVAFGGVAYSLGASAGAAIIIGAAAAVSSTAICAKQLADQGELTTRHGRISMAVLLFQDISAAPLLAALPLLASRTGAGAQIAIEVVRILAILGIIILMGKPILHRLLEWVARRGHAEAFLLASIFLVLTTAWISHHLGISPALGAFIAGLVLGESDFRHRIEDDLRPFRDLMVGLFFITTGAQLNLSMITQSPLNVLFWLFLLVPGKMMINVLALRIARQSWIDAGRSAIILGHSGEFGLLLMSLGLSVGILPATIGQPAMIAIAISMAMAPLLIREHDRLVQLLFHANLRQHQPQLEELEGFNQSKGLQNHVLVCGAGSLGRIVSKALSKAGIPHLLFETRYEPFLQAKEMRLPVIFGDSSRIATLEAAGVERARAVVVTFHQHRPALRILRALRHRFPHLALIVSARTEALAEDLAAIDNITVFHEHVAAGLALARQCLLEVGLARDRLEALFSQLHRELQDD
jgi:CPA2 family monovalent cation:H+ antiporter-2